VVEDDLIITKKYFNSIEKLILDLIEGSGSGSLE